MEEKQTDDMSDNDEDSGNDEPPYPTSVNRNEAGSASGANGDASSSRRSSNADVADVADAVPIQNAPDQGNAPDAADDDAAENNQAEPDSSLFDGNRPRPPAPRNLQHYLNLLAEKRDDNEGQAEAAAAAARIDGEPVDLTNMPAEMLLAIFAFLDDFSLCNAADVCKRWRHILETHTPQAMWMRYTKERWPLFREITFVPSWMEVIIANSCIQNHVD